MQILGLISDGLLLVATLGMAVWCWVLGRRLRKADTPDVALHEKIATLSTQVESLEASLASAASRSEERAEQLATASAQADDRIGQMDMLLASLEDLEEEASDRAFQTVAPTADVEQMPSFRAARIADFGRGGR